MKTVTANPTTSGRRTRGQSAPRRLGPVALTLGTAALALTACSSSSASGGTTTTTSAASRFTAYVTCMKQHGVTLPSNFGQFRRSGAGGSTTRPSFPSGSVPSGSIPDFPRASLPAGVSQSQFQSASAACRSKLPNGGAFGGRGGQFLNNISAYISCLKDNGVTVTGTGPSALAGLDRSNPTVAAAMQTCSPLLRAGTTTTTTPGSSTTG